jgi:hypothetical protein
VDESSDAVPRRTSTTIHTPQTMVNLFRSFFTLTGYTITGSAGAYALWTRKCRISDVPSDDYIFHSTLFTRHNPNNAPVTQDLCLRKVPLDRIRPELLKNDGGDGKLIQAFCAGLWSGKGFAFQRAYLDGKYRGPETADNLWSREELAASRYDVGQRIVDHFEVVAKTERSIIVRCGDSPRIREPRESDGLFELTVDVKRDEGVAEFGLKSVFFNALALPGTDGKPGQAPMDAKTQWLHLQYDKILMETALVNVRKLKGQREI